MLQKKWQVYPSVKGKEKQSIFLNKRSTIRFTKIFNKVRAEIWKCPLLLSLITQHENNFVQSYCHFLLLFTGKNNFIPINAICRHIRKSYYWVCKYENKFTTIFSFQDYLIVNTLLSIFFTNSIDWREKNNILSSHSKTFFLLLTNNLGTDNMQWKYF